MLHHTASTLTLLFLHYISPRLPAWIICNCVIDGLFLLDVVLNFRTGFVDDTSAKPSIVMSSRFIATRYLKSYFALDLVSSLPLDYIITTLVSVRADQASILKVLACRIFLVFSRST